MTCALAYVIFLLYLCSPIHHTILHDQSCTKQFTEDIIEKNIRQAIVLASSKADVCRRIMALEIQGYVVLSNVTDERKAELINPFAMPKYTLTGQDFRQARNR